VQRMFTKKCLLFMVGSVCRVKRFRTGVEKFSQERSRITDDETEVQN
jgi:hypothetical protein